MATQTLSNLANLLASNYGQLIVDSISTDATSSGSHLHGLGSSLFPGRTVTGRLREAGRVFVGGADSGSSGRYARQWPILASAGSAASFAAGDAYPSSTAATYGQAYLDWARVWISMEFDNMANAAAKGTSVVGGASLDAYMREFEAKMKILFAELETELVGAGSGNDLKGMKSFLASTGTYANVNLALNYWNPAVTDLSGAAVSLDNIRAILRTMDNSNARANEIWCSLTQFHKIESLLTTNVRYVDTSTADPLMRAILLDGIPVYPISSMNAATSTDDEIWFVNTDLLELRFLPIAPSAADTGVETIESSFEGYPIGVDVTDTGKDSTGVVMKMYPQLVCLNPSGFAALTGAEIY